jgi:hypothetical protein
MPQFIILLTFQAPVWWYEWWLLKVTCKVDGCANNMISCGLDDQCLIPDRGRNFSLCHCIQTIWHQPRPPIPCEPVTFSPRVKWLRQNYHSSSWITKVKNVCGAVSPLSHMLSMVHKGNFTFTILTLSFYILLTKIQTQQHVWWTIETRIIWLLWFYFILLF